MPGSQEKNTSLDELSVLIRKTGRQMSESAICLAMRPAETYFRNLRLTVDKIGSAPVRRPPPLERYMRQWNEFMSGTRNDLDKGTMRYLCWEPDIATSDRFLAYVQNSGMELGRRPLEGLVRSCHSKWEWPFPAQPPVAIIRALVVGYSGSNPILVKWRSHLEAILGPDGPELLARAFVSSGSSLSDHLAGWYLELQSPFVRQIVEAATAACRGQLGRSSRDLATLLIRELLPWPGWTLSNFKKEVGALILHNAVTEEIRKRFEAFILTHKELGDPRLPDNYSKWAEVPQQARERFLQWLRKEKTSISFERVFREGEGWGWQCRDDSAKSVRYG
jgi:hypothetical protein